MEANKSSNVDTKEENKNKILRNIKLKYKNMIRS